MDIGEPFVPLFDCSLPLAADRAGKAPTLSSLADEKRVVSLLRSTAPRDSGASDDDRGGLHAHSSSRTNWSSVSLESIHA